MNYTTETFASFMFLLFAFSFIACYAQRLYVQYRLEKIKERRGSDDIFDIETGIKERMEMIERTERIKNDDFYIYL